MTCSSCKEQRLLLSCGGILYLRGLLCRCRGWASHCRGFSCGSLRAPNGSAGKESACNARDPGSIPGLGRSPGEGKGCPLHYSGLENSVHGVAKDRTRLSGLHFHLASKYSFEVVFYLLTVKLLSWAWLKNKGLSPFTTAKTI